MNALQLDRISLAGMSYGGWLALNFTAAAPERVQKLALLSPGGFLPLSRQFSLRGMLMMLFPARFMVNSFVRCCSSASMKSCTTRQEHWLAREG